MRTKTEIEQELKDKQQGLEEFQAHGEETHDEYIFQGWVEALEFVLSESEDDVPEDVKDAFELVADVFLRAEFYDGNIAHGEEIEHMEEYIDEMEAEATGWYGRIVFGQEDENGSETYHQHIFITDADLEEWKKSSRTKAPKWHGM